MFRLHLLLLSSCLLLACSQEKPADAAVDSGPPPVPADSLVSDPDSPVTPVPPAIISGTADSATSAAVVWPVPFQPTAANRCARVAARAATVYQRPGAKAPKFGQLTSGENVTLLARTADGWVGFDPATAQAANVGVFRLRWVRAADAFGPAAPACADLPLVQAPPAGCLLMATHPVPVRARPAGNAAQISLIPAGSYARIRAQTSATGKGWTEIEVPGQAAPGYVAEADVNLNGPCSGQ
ncbi:SH3 domain-containing protein [Hymenobacter jeollabukensis]|uniref:SH3 domain-containing protein n=1 Tax=Hymenobacter jeollabukensis TaxID=2025313 RepID=A0A5R8WUV7_9BACT|nr:SH3 domain-containing protein [Hymenobacter jeollabukensis]TLM95283.1 SH3 domain-containing protein [Hymenobacter jeollabukensis]